MFRGALLDLAGVVYQDQEVIPGALDAVKRLRRNGLTVRFVTNTTRSPKKAILQLLTRLGLEVDGSEVFTPAEAACDWLKAHRCHPYLLVDSDLKQEFGVEIDGASRAVVVGDAGKAFNFANLNQAFRELIDGAELVALAKNRMFMDRDGKLSLDAGAFVAALEYASGCEAVLLGKPAPAFFKAALASMNLPAKATVMVGDDAEADVAGALSAGLGAALLVRTGKYRVGDERRFDPPPTATVKDLSAAADWVLDNREART